MSRRWLKPLKKFALLASIMALVMPLVLPSLAAAYTSLSQTSLTLSDNNASATASYDFKFTLGDASSSLGSIEFQFCSNSALITDPCDAPAGFSAVSATLTTQAGATGFTISPLSTANNIILSRTPAIPASANLEYLFNNVTNPNAAGSDYVRVQTFPTSDASGANTNQGGLAFAILSQVQVQAQVPPYITFCAAVTISGFNCANANGDYVDFGELSSRTTAFATQQLLVQTNAKSGYNITVNGETMVSGNNALQPLNSGGNSSPGTSQFGLNLVSNQSPAVGAAPAGPGVGNAGNGYGEPNIFRFNSGEVVASAAQASDSRLFTVSYIVNIPPGQAPGIYVATMTYVATGNF